ncbi:hypothetical protein NIB75_11440 [Bacteroides uniformis]|nr:hypothetical protein [Bacteroides uniformis]
MIRIIGRGAPHGKGGTSLPTSAAVGRVIGENGKKLAFSFGIVITLSIFVL